MRFPPARTRAADPTLTPSSAGTPGRVWDLVVVGGGTAGIVGAKTAARFGASVLMIERGDPGGDCLWTGCVPSKSLLAVAEAAASARRADRFGVHTGEVEVDFAGVMKHVHGAIERIAPTDSVPTLQQAGVHVLIGEATFTGPREVTVDGHPVRFRQALVATGASPAMPPIAGLDTSGALTSDTVWGLTSLPKRLAVLGGGSIGCELGQAFARLGSRVTIVEGADRILPREDPDAAAVVAAALVVDGVTLRTGVPVTTVTSAQGTDRSIGGGSLTLGDGSSVEFDELLVAVGRSPRTDAMGLDAAAVQLDDRGFVAVDDRLRTTNRRIYAAGDLTGHPQFTHLAGVHASTAATNAVLGLRRRVSLAAVPRVTFTDPEVAAVGLPTDEKPGRGTVYWSHAHVDRAVAQDSTDGFTKLVVDGNGTVLGATVVSPRAGESLGELTLAVKHGLKTRHLAATTHPYPTFNDGPWNAAISDVQERLTAPGVARLIHAVAGVRRWFRDRG